MYQRKILAALRNHLRQKPITVLTGMRRTGKTTLIKQLLEESKLTNKIYLDLERIDNRELFQEKNYDNILLALKQRGFDSSKKGLLAIDEIQLSPNLPSVLKYFYDHYSFKIIVTGSSSYYLKNLFSESLAGRKKIFELFPLDFGEYLIFNQITYSPGIKLPEAKFNTHEYERLKLFYEDFITYGGFPEVVLSKNPQAKKELLLDIYSSFINIDIKTLADFKSTTNLYNLIKLLAARSGNRLEISKLAGTSGLSRVTVGNYLDLFEQTYLISLVPVFTKNAEREMVKAKKIYFNDTGLLNILAQVSSGAQFENAIYNQLRHYGEIQYYSLKSGHEIDFILDQKIAIEVKETPDDSDFKNLGNLASKINIKQKILIGRNKPANFNSCLWGGDLK